MCIPYTGSPANSTLVCDGQDPSNSTLQSKGNDTCFEPSEVWSKKHYQHWRIAGKRSFRRKLSPCQRFERRLDKLLSEKTRSRYLGDAYTETSCSSSSNPMDEDDDLSEELSRLGEIERNLSRELSQYRWLRSRAQSIMQDEFTSEHIDLDNGDGLEKALSCQAYSDEMSIVAQELRNSFLRYPPPSGAEGSYPLPATRSVESVARSILRLKRSRQDSKGKDGSIMGCHQSAVEILKRKSTGESFPIEGHGLFTLIADLFFGRHEYKMSAICLDEIFDYGDVIRTREGTICVFISLFVLISSMFDADSNLHMLTRLLFPSILTVFVSKIPFNDMEVPAAITILSLRIFVGLQLIK